MTKNGLGINERLDDSSSVLDAASVKISAITLATKGIKEILQPTLIHSNSKHSSIKYIITPEKRFTNSTPLATSILITPTRPSTPVWRNNLGLSRRFSPYHQSLKDTIVKVEVPEIVVKEEKNLPSSQIITPADPDGEVSNSANVKNTNIDSTSHEQHHKNEEPIIVSNVTFCSHCDKLFTNQNECTSHENDCEGDHDRNINNRLFSCEQCDETFPARGVLRAHYVEHKDIKPFSCGVCRKDFFQKVDVTIHHNNEHK